MPSSCVVFDCDLKYTHSIDVSYHKFPMKQPEILQEWITFTGRDITWKPSKWSAVCSRHFAPSDFKDCAYRKYLNASAIPTIRTKITNLHCDKVEREDPYNDYQDECATNEDDISCEETRFLETTCRLCANSKKNLSDYYQYVNLIMKCLSFVNLDNNTCLPTKICRDCIENLSTYSDFVDKVAKAQTDLELKCSRVGCDNEAEDLNSSGESSRTLKIKQEPLASVKIKEEKIDFSAKHKESNWSEINQGSIVVKKPNQILLFNGTNNDNQVTKQNRESKNCEILEIVNLYPPIVDITSATIRELQPYCENIIIPIPPSLENMKIENTNEEVEDEGGTFGYDDYHLATLIEEEHCYCKHPLLLDENKAEISNLAEEIPDVSETIILSRKKKKKSFNCPDCSSNFISKLSLKNHKRFICVIKKTFTLKCKFCIKKFEHPTVLYAHQKICFKRRRYVLKNYALELKKYKRKSVIKEIAEEFGETDNKATESLEKNDKFYCELCERTYSRISNLKKHQSRHRSKDLWNHKCGLCSKLFDKLFDLKRHIHSSKCSGNTIVNTQTNVDESAKSSTNKIIFVCPTCGKQLTSYYSLKAHESIHSDSKSFICETCGKSFSAQTNLCQHKLTHLDVRKFKCHLCPKLFKRSGGLGQHIKSYHLKIKPYQCATCFRPYALKADMMRCKHSVLKN